MKDTQLIILIMIASLIGLGLMFSAYALVEPIDHHIAYKPVITEVIQIGEQIRVSWIQPLLPPDDQTPEYRIMGSLNIPHITDFLNKVDPYYVTFAEILESPYYAGQFGENAPQNPAFIGGQVYCYNVTVILVESLIVEGYNAQHSVGECITYNALSEPLIYIVDSSQSLDNKLEIIPGQEFYITWGIQNQGNTYLTNVTITSILNSGIVDFVSGDGDNCDYNGLKITCNVRDLAPDERYPDPLVDFKPYIRHILTLDSNYQEARWKNTAMVCGMYHGQTYCDSDSAAINVVIDEPEPDPPEPISDVERRLSNLEGNMTIVKSDVSSIDDIINEIKDDIELIIDYFERLLGITEDTLKELR